MRHYSPDVLTTNYKENYIEPIKSPETPSKFEQAGVNFSKYYRVEWFIIMYHLQVALHTKTNINLFGYSRLNQIQKILQIMELHIHHMSIVLK